MLIYSCVSWVATNLQLLVYHLNTLTSENWDYRNVILLTCITLVLKCLWQIDLQILLWTESGLKDLYCIMWHQIRYSGDVTCCFLKTTDKLLCDYNSHKLWWNIWFKTGSIIPVYTMYAQKTRFAVSLRLHYSLQQARGFYLLFFIFLHLKVTNRVTLFSSVLGTRTAVCPVSAKFRISVLRLPPARTWPKAVIPCSHYCCLLRRDFIPVLLK